MRDDNIQCKYFFMLVHVCIYVYINLSVFLGLKDEGDENEMKDMSILPSYGMLSEREKKV